MPARKAGSRSARRRWRACETTFNISQCQTLDLNLVGGASLLPGQAGPLDQIDHVVERKAHDHQREQADPDGVEVVEAGGGVDEVAEPALRGNELADDGADQAEA